MQRIFLNLLFFLFLCLPGAHAQYEAVFPALEGPALLQALRVNYSPDVVLSYGDSRDTLYSRIDARNNNLSCVYTGYTIFLDPTQDPTQDAFAKGINAEHTYPRGLGAGEEPALADMHHLFPTREDVNAARANLPFREVPDGQTATWYYLDQQQNNIPSSNISLYSEVASIGFEPPEAHKGDVARAMFYFYTVYRQQADAEDPNYFESQRETLCEWHFADPVDDTEYQRSEKIAFYQGNPNPFILDCTVAQRSYCTGFSVPCDPVAVKEPAGKEALGLLAVPNPAGAMAKLQYQLPEGGEVQLLLFDAYGRKLFHQKVGHQPAGAYTYPLSVGAFRGAFLVCQLWLVREGGITVDSEKILLAESE